MRGYLGVTGKLRAEKTPPVAGLSDKCKLTQQRQYVLRGLVSLRQNRGTRLLQDLRTRHVRHFGRVVSIFDTATGRRQVVYGVAQGW